MDLKTVIKTEAADVPKSEVGDNYAHFCNVKREVEDNADLIICKREHGRFAGPVSAEFENVSLKREESSIGDFYGTLPSSIVKNEVSPERLKETPLHHSAPLHCPACDKSFKGGKVRLPCLIKHFSKRHNRKSCRLLRYISVEFRT